MPAGLRREGESPRIDERAARRAEALSLITHQVRQISARCEQARTRRAELAEELKGRGWDPDEHWGYILLRQREVAEHHELATVEDEIAQRSCHLEPTRRCMCASAGASTQRSAACKPAWRSFAN